MAVRSNNAAVKAAIRAAVTRGLANGAEIVLDEASSMIMDGQQMGRVYRRRGVEHQASAPGEPPSSDTGRLVQSGHTEVITKGKIMKGRVTWSTDYAEDLEFGSENVEPRPFARPALANTKSAVQRALIVELLGVMPKR